MISKGLRASVSTLLATPDRHLEDSSKRVYETKHFPALDGVRGLAIVLVLFEHSSSFIRDLPIANIFYFGWIGVDLFFVLSGFLITRILLETGNDKQYFRRFYIRRGLRIWPVYYIYFLSVLLFMHAFGKIAALVTVAGGEVAKLELVSPFYLYLLFLQNLDLWSMFSLRDSILGITWSLCIEEHFYLVWPICVRNLSRRTLSGILIVVVALSPFLRLTTAYLGRNQPYWTWYQMINRFTPLHLDALAAGCLLCLVWSRTRNSSHWIYGFRALFGVGLACFIVCFFNIQDRYIFSFCYTALAAMFTGLVGLTMLGRLSILFTQPSLRYLGKISFGLYLIHPTIFIIFSSHAFFHIIGMAGHAKVAGCLTAVPAIGLSIYIAHLSWKFFESRVLALKSRFAP
jgi:peptidoglycan/LPS O-acetylase OafA/YrhL